MKNNYKFYTAYGEGQYSPLSYYDESEEENKLVEYDFLFTTLNEALEFIKPISEKYNEPLIGVSGVCIDDVFNAY